MNFQNSSFDVCIFALNNRAQTTIETKRKKNRFLFKIRQHLTGSPRTFQLNLTDLSRTNKKGAKNYLNFIYFCFSEFLRSQFTLLISFSFYWVSLLCHPQAQCILNAVLLYTHNTVFFRSRRSIVNKIASTRATPQNKKRPFKPVGQWTFVRDKMKSNFSKWLSWENDWISDFICTICLRHFNSFASIIEYSR